MPKEVLFVGPRRIEVRDYEDRSPGPREVKVRNLYSGIGVGDELNHYRGVATPLHKAFEPDGFRTEGQAKSYPFSHGQEDVARVVEVGADVTEVEVGDAVTCWVQHRETGIFDMDQTNVSTRSIFVRLPEDKDLEKYVFVTLGTAALEGVLLGAVKLGESAVVVGQGVVGLLAMQFCKLSGADPVIAVDLLPHRLEAARRLGADHVLNPRDVDVGREVKRILGGHGADVCFDCSGKTAGLALALRCGTPFPRVVAVGWYEGPASDLYLDEEFGASGGQILFSQSGGHRLRQEVPTGGRYHRKWNIVRITETVVKLLKAGKLSVDGLISHRFQLAQATEAFDLIDRHPELVTKVIFDLS